MWICLPTAENADHFQDPYASLDRGIDRGDIIGEALDIHKMYGSTLAGIPSTPCWISWG